MTYEEARTLIQEHLDYGGSLDSHGLAVAMSSLQSIADTAGAKAVNGIPATLRHDEGAIARCSYCGRYSLDPKTLSNRQPKCECGEEHGWSGSFKKPDGDAQWSGAAPPAPSVADAAGASESAYQRGYLDGMAKARKEND